MAGPSNYPNGFLNGVTIRGLPITTCHPGEVFWVNNSGVLPKGGVGGSNGNDGSYKRPFSTIDYAIGRCTANRGDIIMVMPGHAENLATAAVIAADVAGIAVVGLGRGTKMPTLSWTAAAATLAGSAANISFVNMKFVANFADVTTMFDLTGGADGWSFENCVFTDTSTVLNALDFITLATGADDLSFVGCRVIGKSASNDSFITGVAHDRLYIDNCQIQFDVAQTAVVGVIETSGNATNVWIKDSLFRSNVDGALFLDFNGTANSGGVTNCYFSSIDTAGATTAGFDFTGGHFFECYVAGEPDTFGLVGGGTVYNDA
jgi:hypothetical protein